MKKKYLSIMMILCLCLTAGCSANDNSTESNSTENASDKTQETKEDSPKKEEETSGQTTDTADDFYNVCTSLPAQDVENYADNVRSLILAHDWNSLAEELSYPITINETTCADSAAFLALDIDNNVSQEFLDAIEAETCKHMFCNWEGISLGAEGQVWIAAILNSSVTEELKVSALNGFLN